VIGVWRLNTGSKNAAVETADTGEVLERARGMDVYLPAQALIHWRPGQDGHPYPVPVLRPSPSAEQLAALPTGMDGMLAQLGAGETQKAITSGAPKRTESDETPPAATPTPRPAAAPVTAQQIADLAHLAQTRGDIDKLAARAKEADLADDLVDSSRDGEPEVFEELKVLLNARWMELPAPQRGRSQPRQRAPEPAAGAAAEPEGGSLFDGDPAWDGQ